MKIYFLNILIFLLSNKLCYTYCDMSSPVNYQPIKYSQIFLEINYTTSNGRSYQKHDISQPHSLITVLNTRKDMFVSGRLILAMTEKSIYHNETQSIETDGGCSRITTVSDVPWIAVILKGGQCSLKDKLQNALHYSNASAVIIIDGKESTNEKYDFSNAIGLHLKDLAFPLHILKNESIFVNVSITINNFLVDGFISRTSVLFVSISFILLMIISLVWLTFYYIQRFRYLHAKERLSRRLANAAKKALNKIPLKTLTTGDNEVSYDFDQCAICIDNYQVGETIRILPCKHIFHKICIDSWLIEQRSCPMCKVDILKACGILSVSSNKSPSNRPSVLLEAGLISSDPETGDSSTFDAVESNVNVSSRCRRGKSSFLQRYRDRYGLHHYYQGHIKNHCHKYEGHSHRKCIHHCSNHRDKYNPAADIVVDVSSMLNKIPSEQTDAERVDLISESENSIASLNQLPLNSTTTKEDDKTTPCLPTNYEHLHRISLGLVCDICECISENTPPDCDICGAAPNHSTSTSCSCESCDCYFIERECQHFDGARNNNAGIGNLLGCCVSSGLDRQRTHPRNLYDRNNPGLCCYNLCSHCRNRSLGHAHIENDFPKSHLSHKQCSSKSRCKMSLTEYQNPIPAQLTNNLINSNQFTKIPNTKPYLSNVRSRKDDYGNVKQLKSIQLSKNSKKCATIDSFTKSSLSDEFDYEADGGSSSLEISVPAVKLTVLPPQVQYHQGSPNSDSSHSSSQSVEIHDIESTENYKEPNRDTREERDTCNSDSIIIPSSSDLTSPC